MWEKIEKSGTYVDNLKLEIKMCPTFLLFKNLENKLLTTCTSRARMFAYQAAVVKLELKMQQVVKSFIAEEVIGYYITTLLRLLLFDENSYNIALIEYKPCFQALNPGDIDWFQYFWDKPYLTADTQ